MAKLVLEFKGNVALKDTQAMLLNEKKINAKISELNATVEEQIINSKEESIKVNIF